MCRFKDVPSDAGEPDWFPEWNDEALGPVDYASIPDMSGASLEALVEDVLDEEESDGVTWRECKDLTDAMDCAFQLTANKLWGRELPGSSRFLADYLEQLGKGCEITVSNIFTSQARWNMEPAMRIKSCLAENGCVLAAVADAEWQPLVGEQESDFFDSGQRIIYIEEIEDDKIIVQDFVCPGGDGLAVPIQDFCQLHGVLLEVYK